MRFATGASRTEPGTAVRPSRHRIPRSGPRPTVDTASRPPEYAGSMSPAMLLEIRTALFPDPIPREMRIALRRLRFRVPEQTPDHRQAHTERESRRSEGVAQITLQRDTRRGVQIDSKAVRYPLGGSLHRIPCKVGVAGGGVDPHTNPTR